MIHPYSTAEYANGLLHIGEPVCIPEWGTTVLRCACSPDHEDASGTYPIAVFKRGCDLTGGVDRLKRLGFVSVVLVFENALRPELAELQQSFDFVRPFKLHYIYERSKLAIGYSKHHRYEIRRATQAVRIERFDLAKHFAAWIALYENLVQRRGLAKTMHAFPRAHHEMLATLPGAAAIGAFAGDRLVSCHVWVCHEGHAMSHLAASSEEGYALRAAYAVNAFSIELLSECRILNFGGAAGKDADDDAGLARFKRGFSNTTAPAYLCGKVLAREAYYELSRQFGVSAGSAYFPAYRSNASVHTNHELLTRRLKD